MGRNPHFGNRWIIAILVAAVSVGCSAIPMHVPPSGPYHDDIIQAQRNARSILQRNILSDGIVTSDEYREAVNAFIDCVKAKGVRMELVDVGGYFNYRSPTADAEKFSKVDSQCSDGTTDNVEDLYVQVLTNPEKKDRDEIVAACLVRHRAVREGFTAAELRQLQSNGRPQGAAFGDIDPSIVKGCSANPMR